MSDMNIRHFLDIDKWASESSLNDGHGLLRPNRYICLLNAPPGLAGLGHNGWLEWQVLSVNCPAIAMETESMEINSFIHYYLKNRSDNEFEVTFLETADLTVRYFFHEWMNYGFNMMTGVRNYIDNVEAEVVKICPLNYEGDMTRADVFYGVFPVNIGSLDYDYSANDTFLKTTVRFKFIAHRIEHINPKTDAQHTATQTKSAPAASNEPTIDVNHQ